MEGMKTFSKTVGGMKFCGEFLRGMKSFKEKLGRKSAQRFAEVYLSL